MPRRGMPSHRCSLCCPFACTPAASMRAALQPRGGGGGGGAAGLPRRAEPDARQGHQDDEALPRTLGRSWLHLSQSPPGAPGLGYHCQCIALAQSSPKCPKFFEPSSQQADSLELPLSCILFDICEKFCMRRSPIVLQNQHSNFPLLNSPRPGQTSTRRQWGRCRMQHRDAEVADSG